MPIHDWTKVPPGIFHHFRGAWIFELARELNQRVLPPGYYALGEQVASDFVPDALALERTESVPARESPRDAREEAPMSAPETRIAAIAEAPQYPPKPRVLAIRHTSGDRLVAVIEILSRSNKRDETEIASLIEKAGSALEQGIRVTLIDLYPPSPVAPRGVHNLLWEALGQEPLPFSDERPLVIASYVSEGRIGSFVEPCATGQPLPGAPLFLTPTLWVALPLESTYSRAFASPPDHIQHGLALPV